MTGTQLPAHCPQSMMWPALAFVPLCQAATENPPPLHLFNQSTRCTEWEQIIHTTLPPCCPSKYVLKVSANHTSVPLLKRVSVGATAILSHFPAFHTLQVSGKSRVYTSQGHFQPSSSPSSRVFQDTPHFLTLWWPATTASGWVYHQLCACVLLLFLW